MPMPPFEAVETGMTMLLAVLFLKLNWLRRGLVNERPWTVEMPDDEVAATAEGDEDVIAERDAVAAMTSVENKLVRQFGPGPLPQSPPRANPRSIHVPQVPDETLQPGWVGPGHVGTPRSADRGSCPRVVRAVFKFPVRVLSPPGNYRA